ncbi:phosphoglycolate phosphatase [Pseudoxanthobacter sp.]|uniref:phosphoglycolate phosphatase n=1 Tax=Pseudoxanthobacter sp. TaxID=1925742 RepID=UPI002FE1D9DA
MRPTLVFDLDGTLVETAPDLSISLNRVLASEGLPPTSEAEVRAMVGRGGRVLITRALAAHGISVTPERLEQLFRRFLAFYEEGIDRTSYPYPGVEEALDRFAAAGWTLAVCTNKPEKLSVLLLERLGLADRFGAIVGQETFGVSKPDPQHIVRTVEAAGGDPGQAVMVGDSINDVAAARAAGIPVIVVSFGYSDRPVAALEADVVIDSFDRLWDAVSGVRVPA